MPIWFAKSKTPRAAGAEEQESGGFYKDCWISHPACTSFPTEGWRVGGCTWRNLCFRGTASNTLMVSACKMTRMASRQSSDISSVQIRSWLKGSSEMLCFSQEIEDRSRISFLHSGCSKSVLCKLWSWLCSPSHLWKHHWSAATSRRGRQTRDCKVQGSHWWGPQSLENCLILQRWVLYTLYIPASI